MSKQDYVFQVFERVAADYDTANARISLGQHTRWKRCAVRQLLSRVSGEVEILDLCCGTGDISALLLEERPILRVCAVDFSPAMLAQAHKRLGTDGRVRFVQGNAMALPLPDSCMDGAVISFALRNIEKYDQALRELARVCRAGAPLVVIDSYVPECALIRPFYYLYFSYLMPILGGGRACREEYRWLSRSTKAFLRPSQVPALLARCGFIVCETAQFMLGACVSICARKNSEGTL